MPKITYPALEEFAIQYLVDAGCSLQNASPVARSLVKSEIFGHKNHGLHYLAVFKKQLDAGRIDGQFIPVITKNEGGSIVVDAGFGFAHPAIELGTAALIKATRENGIAALAVTRSYNCLALGHHVLPLAKAGLIGFCSSNASASVALPGGTRPVFGTNPLAFAVPGEHGPSLLIDQAASVVARSELLVRMDKGESIPEGWAQDAEGNPTTDPAAGFAGAMLPFGGQKGANIALIVEILAAVLTGSNLSVEASPFGATEGDKSNVGQFIFAIDPAKFAGPAFQDKMTGLASIFSKEGLRLPGQNYRGVRKSPENMIVTIDDTLWEKLNSESGKEYRKERTRPKVQIQ